MRVLVTGSRDWDDYEAITDALVEAVLQWIKDHPEVGTGETTWVTVVHGACPTGADRMADDFCTKVTNWTVERHPAKWRVDGRYDPAAGFKRNVEMAASGIDLCLAFIKNNSNGATHCANTAEHRFGVPTIRYRQ